MGGLIWREPVATRVDLPLLGSCDSDTRLVQSENAVYVFDATVQSWQLLSASGLQLGDLVKVVVDDLPSYPIGLTGYVVGVASKAVLIRWSDGGESPMHESWLEKTDIITGVGGIGG
jgi:hypothetical protein